MEAPSSTQVQVTEELRPDGGIVVGDDGSRYAEAAVRAGAVEAALRQVPLHVVRAWSLTSAVKPHAPFGVVASLVEFEAATAAAQRRRVTDLLDEVASRQLQIHVVHAPAAKALLTAGQSADLLVVGYRGQGGFDRLLLGSVAEQCVRHATCSVLVARD